MHQLCVPLKMYLNNLFSLLAGVAVDAPPVLFGADDEVLGTQLKFQSISAASVRHEEPSLALLNSRLHTCSMNSQSAPDSSVLFQNWV